MTQTPEPDTETATGRRSGYLPVLPDGWEYEIRLRETTKGIDVVTIDPGRGVSEGRCRVGVTASNGSRTLWEDTLGEAIRTAVKAAKALSRLAKSEAEFQAARKAALDSIGGEEEPDDAEVEASTPEAPFGKAASPGPAVNTAGDDA